MPLCGQMMYHCFMRLRELAAGDVVFGRSGRWQKTSTTMRARIRVKLDAEDDTCGSLEIGSCGLQLK